MIYLDQFSLLKSHKTYIFISLISRSFFIESDHFASLNKVCSPNFKDGFNTEVITGEHSAWDSLLTPDHFLIRNVKQLHHLKHVVVVEKMVEGPLERRLNVRVFWHCFLAGQCLIKRYAPNRDLVVMVGAPQVAIEGCKSPTLGLPLEHVINLDVQFFLFAIDLIRGVGAMKVPY